MTTDGNPKEFEDRLKQLGIKTYVFKSRQLAELPEGIRELGMFLGAKEKAYKLADEIESKLKKSEVRGTHPVDGSHHSLLPIEADAIITNIKNLPIGVFTADCLPIVLADIRGRVVGIIHAGRVGTSLEITKKTVGKIKENFGISAEEIIAAIGPGIGGCCYEVDEKSINPFKDRLEYFEKIAIEKYNGRWMLNLIGVNKIQLMESGLKSENIFTAEFCTSCHNDKFFSYRREGKTAGRMVSFVAIKG